MQIWNTYSLAGLKKKWQYICVGVTAAKITQIFRFLIGYWFEDTKLQEWWLWVDMRWYGVEWWCSVNGYMRYSLVTTLSSKLAYYILTYPMLMLWIMVSQLINGIILFFYFIWLFIKLLKHLKLAEYADLLQWENFIISFHFKTS